VQRPQRPIGYQQRPRLGYRRFGLQYLGRQFGQVGQGQRRLFPGLVYGRF
jgi:hypothetical protein